MMNDRNEISGEPVDVTDRNTASKVARSVVKTAKVTTATATNVTLPDLPTGGVNGYVLTANPLLHYSDGTFSKNYLWFDPRRLTFQSVQAGAGVTYVWSNGLGGITVVGDSSLITYSQATNAYIVAGPSDAIMYASVGEFIPGTRTQPKVISIGVARGVVKFSPTSTNTLDLTGYAGNYLSGLSSTITNVTTKSVTFSPLSEFYAVIIKWGTS